MILFSVAGNTLAISATAVEEIRNLDGLKPLPGEHIPRKATCTFYRDGQLYWAVDAAEYLHLPHSKATRLMVLRNNGVAVLVDEIQRMVEVGRVVELPKAFKGEERRWFRGLALLQEKEGIDVVAVANPDSFLTTEERAVLQS